MLLLPQIMVAKKCPIHYIQQNKTGWEQPPEKIEKNIKFKNIL